MSLCVRIGGSIGGGLRSLQIFCSNLPALASHDSISMFQGTTRSMQDIAVKVLSAESRQGTREFLTEIDVISNVKHPNLVELIGCCVEGDHRILVYEYLENGSLDRALLSMNLFLQQFIKIIIVFDLTVLLMFLQVLTVNLLVLLGA
jgi:hypothetical protein